MQPAGHTRIYTTLTDATRASVLCWPGSRSSRDAGVVRLTKRLVS
jgi:hypothetical protein